MGIFHGIIEHWSEILDAIGVFGGISGLFFTAYSIREETKARRVANLIAITSSHRDLWKESFGRPGLSRINDPKANPDKKPVTQEEQAFANFVILHLNSAYYAMKDEVVIKLQGLRRDAHSFLSKPVPRAVWENTKKFQNDDFVEFVEDCIRGGKPFKACSGLPWDRKNKFSVQRKKRQRRKSAGCSLCVLVEVYHSD